MKRKSYVKNQIRSIFKTKARFLSIFIIVFLGASFFSGLRHAPMIMESSMDQFVSENHFNDLNYIATLGFSKEDVSSIRDIDEIDQIEAGMRFDALVEQGEQDHGVTVYTRDDFNKKINTVEIKEGRLPTKEDECIIDFQMKKRYQYALNQKITLKTNQGQKEFKVVGIVNDPRYISNMDRGSNTLGDGTNIGYIQMLTKDNQFLALPQSLYDLRKEEVLYNEVRITLKESRGNTVFSETYQDIVKEANYKIKNILVERFDALYTDITKEAKEQLQVHQTEYEEGYTQYQTGLATFNATISNAKIELTNAKIEIAKNRKVILEAKSKMNAEMGALPGQIQDANKQLEELKQQLEELKKESGGIPSLPEIPPITPDTPETPPGVTEQIDEIIQQIEAVQNQIGNMDTLVTSMLALDTAALTLDKADLEIQKNENNLVLQEIATNKQFEESKKILEEAKIQLEQGQIALDSIPKGNVITLTSTENAGIMGFQANSDSITSLSLLFPLLFFLVAALVSLTTMTRMVEEQRVQSGTYRALGYSKKEVILQYIIYAFLATFVASVLGIIFGVYFFPWIIYFLYCTMMYDIGAPIHFIFDIFICIQTFIISVAITLVVTWIVCMQELSLMPAGLLRPKAPKIGKRILLERVTWVWKRLSFNQKVTMRNIFRYKKRFFMSVIGIAGCTALIVIGFGLKESVSLVADEQYGNVWQYSGTTHYKEKYDDKQMQEIEQELDKRQEVKNFASYYSNSISFVGEKKEYYGTLEIPREINEFQEMISLNSYNDGSPLHLNDEGVMISAKISELLGVEVGDTITIAIEGKEYQVKVSGIVEFYFMHYMYMTKSYYESLTGTKVLYDGTYFTLKDEDIKFQNTLESYVHQNDVYSGVSFVSGISENFRNQMVSIDGVVLILIVCAGSLAFVVLYNLTNINIQERKSEIATIKVLGFYPKEVYQYVFRENILLAFIGSLVGLLLGKAVHMYLIKTVEIEMTMFVRELFFPSYIIAVILTMVFTMAINLMMRRVLKKIDMVESLKSIE